MLRSQLFLISNLQMIIKPGGKVQGGTGSPLVPTSHLQPSAKKTTAPSRRAAHLRRDAGLTFLLKRWIMGDYQGCKKPASVSPLCVRLRVRV